MPSLRLPGRHRAPAGPGRDRSGLTCSPQVLRPQVTPNADEPRGITPCSTGDRDIGGHLDHDLRAHPLVADPRRIPARSWQGHRPRLVARMQERSDSPTRGRGQRGRSAGDPEAAPDIPTQDEGLWRLERACHTSDQSFPRGPSSDLLPRTSVLTARAVARRDLLGHDTLDARPRRRQVHPAPGYIDARCRRNEHQPGRNPLLIEQLFQNCPPASPGLGPQVHAVQAQHVKDDVGRRGLRCHGSCSGRPSSQPRKQRVEVEPRPSPDADLPVEPDGTTELGNPVDDVRECRSQRSELARLQVDRAVVAPGRKASRPVELAFEGPRPRRSAATRQARRHRRFDVRPPRAHPRTLSTP